MPKVHPVSNILDSPFTIDLMSFSLLVDASRAASEAGSESVSDSVGEQELLLLNDWPSFGSFLKKEGDSGSEVRGDLKSGDQKVRRRKKDGEKGRTHSCGSCGKLFRKVCGCHLFVDLSFGRV